MGVCVCLKVTLSCLFFPYVPSNKSPPHPSQRAHTHVKVSHAQYVLGHPGLCACVCAQWDHIVLLVGRWIMNQQDQTHNQTHAHKHSCLFLPVFHSLFLFHPFVAMVTAPGRAPAEVSV